MTLWAITCWLSSETRVTSAKLALNELRIKLHLHVPHLWEAQIALNLFHFFLPFWFKFSTTEKLGKVSYNSSITYSSSATPYQDTSTSFLQGQKQIHSCLRRRFNIGQNAFQDFSLKAIRQRTSNADIWPTAFIVYVEKHLLKLLE